jgi:hypothetical protein
MTRFRSTIALDSKRRLYLPLPFDPDVEWGDKPRHHVRGHIGPVRTRGAVQKFDGVWGLRLNPLSQAACELGEGDTVNVELWPEGPQMEDLAPDIMVALGAEPQAMAAFQGLATFYRKGWLTWIDGTKRRPDERARRIAQMVALVKTGEKQRPR